MELTVAGKAVFAGTGGRPFDPARPAIVFLHGAGMDHTVWALPARYFAHHGRGVLAVDLPGHGRSAGPALGSVEALAEWLGALLAAAGLAQAALAGHSLGALVALEAAARLPGKIRALALLGAAAEMPVHPELLAAARENDHRAFEFITSWGHGQAGHLGGNRLPGLWLLGSGERLLERGRPNVLAADLNACAAYRGGAQAAARVACPCRLVLGAEDRMTPTKAGRRLGETIPGAAVSTIAACGHMMMLERPDETLDALRAVL